MDKSRSYFRPIVQSDGLRSKEAVVLAGGAHWFDRVEIIGRDRQNKSVPVGEVPPDVLEKLCAPRTDFAGLSMDHPKLMGVLNVTPDSFSDGGDHFDPAAAIHRGEAMFKEGADIVDIGGESTRPGADFVDSAAEIGRISPVVEGLKGKGVLSIDTRKSDVADVALSNGTNIFNDVTALSFDPASLGVAAKNNSYVCLMHASGDPKTMQDNPEYKNVVLDVYDYLEARIQTCEEAGIPRARIMIDPGIGFGKTTAHNLLLIRKISIFHGLGCPILLGVSRKRFIGELGKVQEPADRLGGSLAIGLEGLRQGVQVLRVHDVAQTKQAMRLMGALQED